MWFSFGLCVLLWNELSACCVSWYEWNGLCAKVVSPDMEWVMKVERLDVVLFFGGCRSLAKFSEVASHQHKRSSRPVFRNSFDSSYSGYKKIYSLIMLCLDCRSLKFARENLTLNHRPVLLILAAVTKTICS
ncbi:hypothetical protein AVEN_144537-1 [Araneus ventricosus]|uniref:Secreted protein n=1 Tax=Araneus ventricosus TaxID=182803 RepID=A0A4Y2ISY4_ARAVE|nr:hypothetical protein AVEN_144537-1 [Araneus ventricosus]